MDKIIAKYDFAHDDEDKCDQFREEARYWNSEHSENAGVKDVEKALTVLADKLTKGKVPDYGTQGWKQAKYAHSVVNTIAVNRIDNGDMQPSQVHGIYYEYIVRLMEAGPATVHMHIVSECVSDSDIKLGDFLKGLQGDKMKQLLTEITKDVTPKETTERKEFYSMFDSYISQFNQKFITEDILKANQTFFMDFQNRLYLDHLNESETICNSLAALGDYVLRGLDNPWMIFQDIPAIKLYFQRCSKVFRTPKLVTHNRAKTVLRDYVYKLCKGTGTRGLSVELYNDVFDLLLAVSEWSYPDDEEVVRMFGQVLTFFRNLKSPHVTKNPNLFQGIAKRYEECMEKLDMKFLEEKRFPSILMDDVLEKAYSKNKQLNAQWVGMVVVSLKRPCISSLNACRTILYCDDTVKWKEHPEIAQQVFDIICQLYIPEHYDKDKRKDYIKTLTTVTERFLDGLKKCRMLKDYSESLIFLSMRAIELNDSKMFCFGEEVAERVDINVKESKKSIMEVLQRVHVVIKSEDYPWDDKWELQRAVVDLIEALFKPVKDAKTYTVDELKEFLKVAKTCQNYDCLNPSTGQFASARFLCKLPIMNKVFSWLVTIDRFDIAADLLPGILKSYDEAEDDTLFAVNSNFLANFGMAKSGLAVAGNYLGDIIQIFFKTEHDSILRVIELIYPANPKALQQHYRPLVEILIDSANETVLTYLAMLFLKVSKLQADLFTEKDMKAIIEKAKSNGKGQPALLQICQELCKRRPEVMVKHIDLLIEDATAWESYVHPIIDDMISVLALYDKNVAPKSLNYMINSLKTHHGNALSSLMRIRLIGFKYPELLKPKRSELEKMPMSDSNEDAMRKTILDMIDGNTPEDLRIQLSEQQQELNDLVGRVDETETAVAVVKDEVNRQGQELDNVRMDVDEHGERIDKVEATVEDTVAKVEEIDQKTLSHAPYWSRDVSKLLNPLSDHDWRLLSSRLGYSNDDIRGWAQQADPCMAMLNEWYATRKTSEATFAIYTQLVEMDRHDAAIIVENAMKNAEAVVEDEDFEYASPPAIFISYQWGHQEEVKLLKQHLEMAGYVCWLDIGQMGGGDKLFQKIDTGIRAAKIIISCVTTKYAKSPNCNREVNLSVGLNKLIIPLLLEKCTWPPPGSMGPIFSEYLFIRFFQRTGEELPDSDQRYWPTDKFQELLMQLNMLGLEPEEGKIEPLYRNWWIPVVEEINIDKSRTKDGGNSSQTEQSEIDKNAAVSPDVFISYQWGKQKNIIPLYERLTSLGLSCWLDIKQMGGGDSLYDKIDRGIRGCRVVLCCVTQKYSLSANCRREISLADALKKPLLPLLLESMTWPPSGPMSMVMTQLLYIDFTEEEVQTKWNGPKFDELLNKIYEKVPHTTQDKSKREEENETEKKSAVIPIARASYVPTKKEELHTDSSQKKDIRDSEKSTTSVMSASTRPASKERQEKTTKGPLPSPSQQGPGNGRRSSPRPSSRPSPSTQIIVQPHEPQSQQYMSPQHSASSGKASPRPPPSQQGGQDGGSWAFQRTTPPAQKRTRNAVKAVFIMSSPQKTQPSPTFDPSEQAREPDRKESETSGQQSAKNNISNEVYEKEYNQITTHEKKIEKSNSSTCSLF